MSEIFKTELLHFKDVTITLGSVVFSLIIILANIFLLKFLKGLIIRRKAKDKKPDGRLLAINQLLKYILWIITIIICFQILSVDITFLIASSAALLVGIGLGMQIIFKDFMSGILLLIEGTVKVNDILVVENEVIKVIEISLRTSRVITRDDNIVIIPNHKFIEENVINWTHNTEPTRFIIDVGVDYSSDVELVRSCLLEAAAKNNDVYKSAEYKPFVRFNDFGGSALEFQLLFWSHNLFRIETTKSNIRFEISRLFRGNGITIPFKQIVLHKGKNF